MNCKNQEAQSSINMIKVNTFSKNKIKLLTFVESHGVFLSRHFFIKIKPFAVGFKKLNPNEFLPELPKLFTHNCFADQSKDAIILYLREVRDAFDLSKEINFEDIEEFLFTYLSNANKTEEEEDLVAVFKTLENGNIFTPEEIEPTAEILEVFAKLRLLHECKHSKASFEK